MAYLCDQRPSKTFFDSEGDFEEKLFEQIKAILVMDSMQNSLLTVVSDKEAEAILLQMKSSALSNDLFSCISFKCCL